MVSRIVVPSLVQAADVAPELAAQLDVDAGGRLVEDHQPRLVQQRAGEQQAAALAAGELRRPHVGLGAQVEDVDHLLGALAPTRAAVEPEVAAVVDERLAHGEEAVEVGVLLGDADHPPRLEAWRRRGRRPRSRRR